MKRQNKNFDIIVYSMMIVAVVYAVIQSLKGNNQTFSFKLTLGIWIMLAVALGDFVEPLINRSFEKITKKEGLMYTLYAVCDVFAYVFLYLFVININYFKEPVHYLFLVCGGILFTVKFVFYEKYSHENAEKEKEEELSEDELVRKAKFNSFKQDRANNLNNANDGVTEVQTFKRRNK